MRAYTPGLRVARLASRTSPARHAVKVGYTLTMGEYEQTAFRVGNMTFMAINGVPNTVTYLRHADAGASTASGPTSGSTRRISGPSIASR